MLSPVLSAGLFYFLRSDNWESLFSFHGTEVHGVEGDLETITDSLNLDVSWVLFLFFTLILLLPKFSFI